MIGINRICYADRFLEFVLRLDHVNTTAMCHHEQ